MIGITGKRSAITQALLPMLPPGEEAHYAPRAVDMPLGLDRYFLCAGLLVGRQVGEISDRMAGLTWEVNFVQPARLCDRILAHNPRARICVVGSESGFAGSFDEAYAGAKAALHLYVETKRLEHPGQQLVAIAPGIVGDSGMTQRRADLDATLERGRARRRGRWLDALEVARVAHFLLYVDQGSITNTVIRQTGGTW